MVGILVLVVNKQKLQGTSRFKAICTSTSFEFQVHRNPKKSQVMSNKNFSVNH